MCDIDIASSPHQELQCINPPPVSPGYTRKAGGAGKGGRLSGIISSAVGKQARNKYGEFLRGFRLLDLVRIEG